MIKKLFNKIIKAFKKIIDIIKQAIKEKKDKWTLCLYWNGVLIKKQKVEENFQPIENLYKISLRNKKYLIGTNKKVDMLFKFDKYKMTNNEKKEVHIEIVVDKGVDMK